MSMTTSKDSSTNTDEILLVTPGTSGGELCGLTHCWYCTICEMFLGKRHVEEHLTGMMHRENQNKIGDQPHIGTVSRPVSSSEPAPASSSEAAVQAGQGLRVRVALLSMAGHEVGAINVAPDCGWRAIAVGVLLQFPNFRVLPPADEQAATGASMAVEGVRVIII